MDYKNICKAAGLDEIKIVEIFTQRRCDYIDKRIPSSHEGSLDTWKIIKAHRLTALGLTKPQKKNGVFDDKIRRLSRLAKDDTLSAALRKQCRIERDKLSAQRKAKVAWGGTEKRITELRKLGKIVKTPKEVRTEQILELLVYIQRERVETTDRNIKILTIDESYGLTAQIYNALPDNLSIKTLHGKRVTKGMVKYTFTNAFQNNTEAYNKSYIEVIKHKKTSANL